MADIFLNSVDGSDLNSGADWNNEKDTLATGIAGIDAAGDRVLINSAHVEGGTTMNYTSPGAVTTPLQFLSVTPSGTSGISSLTAGALIDMSGTTFEFKGHLYAYGITFRGTTTSTVQFNFGTGNGDEQVFESCALEMTGTSGSSFWAIGNASTGGGSRIELKNCTFKLGATGQRFEFSSEVNIRGGSWASGGTAPTSPFRVLSGGRSGKLLVEGFDFTNAGTTVNLIGYGQGGSVAVFRDCIMAASWTGEPVTNANLQPGQRVELWNYRVGASTWHRFWIKDVRGEQRPETTIVRTGGGSDADGNYSIKFTTTANIAYPTAVARSMELVAPNSTTGSSITVTCEIIHDSVTALDDDEIWLEVEEPDGTVTTDAMATVIATPAAQTSSSETWTTTGLTNPNKQKLAVTINASRAGNLLCRVVCAKPSKTVYICPKLAVA